MCDVLWMHVIKAQTNKKKVIELTSIEIIYMDFNYESIQAYKCVTWQTIKHDK